ncbi:MAG: PAS domain S-box protein, partial [Deltaproteobacteria bacterium]
MVAKPTYEELKQKIKELELEAIKHKKIELSLTENRELFREMFEQSPIGIELYDSDGKLLKINKSCLEIFGVIDENELKGFDLFDDPNVTDEVKKKLQNGESVRYETTFDFDKINELQLYKTTKSGILHLDVVIVAFQLHDNRSSVGYLVNVQDNTKRKQAEDALRENKERYRVLSNASFEAIFISENGICIDTNQKATEMLGYEFEEIIGTFGADFIAPESKELAKQNMLSGYEEPYEAIVQRKDGSTFYSEIRGKMMDFKDRRVRLTVLHDIDGRKQAEKRQLFRENIIKSSSSSIATCDLDYNMSYANPTFLKKWGFVDPAEFLGRPFWNFWAVKPVLNEIMQAIKDKGAWSGELQAIRKDGTFFDVEVSAAIVFDSKGNPVALTSTSIDITKRKQEEARRRKSEEKYRLLADNATDVILTMDMDLNYTYFSPSVTKLTGFTVEEALALSFEESMTPSSFNEAMKAIDEDLEMHKKGQNPQDRSRTVEIEFKCKDGSTIPTEVEGNFLYDSSGQPEGFIGIARDITERKNTEKRQMFQRNLAIALNKTSTLDETVTEILSNLFQLDEFDSGGVYLFDEKTGRLIFMLSKGLPQAFVDEVKYFDPNDIRIQMIMKGDTFFLPACECPIPIREDLEKYGLIAIAVLPIKFREKVIGSINLASRTHDVISDYSMSILKSISEIEIGVSISRVITEETLNKTNERLEETVKERTAEIH